MFKLLFSLALWSAALIAQAAPVPLTVDGKTFQFPMESNYVQLSSAEPKLFAFAQAALPTTNRLVEAFMTRDDIGRASRSEAAKDIYYQVQVLRTAETTALGINDWNALKPQLTSGMTQADVHSMLSDVSGNNDRMSAVAGKQVAVSYGNVAAPVVYRQTPLSVNFGMLLPLKLRVNGQDTSTTIAAAGSFVLVHNRLLYIYAFSPRTSAADIAKVRQRLNDVVDKTLAMNP